MSITALTTEQKVLVGHALLFLGIAIYFFTKALLSALKNGEVWTYGKSSSRVYLRDRNRLGYWMVMVVYACIDIWMATCWLVGLYRMFL
jgi:hypothetical protein